MTTLTLTRAAVFEDGRRAAYLRWSGRAVTVMSPRGKALGRLLPVGYATGRPDDGSGLYDAWTAKHPHVPTPSDVIIKHGEGLSIAGCVALILGA